MQYLIGEDRLAVGPDDPADAVVAAVRAWVEEHVPVGWRDAAGRGSKWLVLLGDSALPEDFRRLRVWLRWRRDVGSGRSPTRANTE